MTRQEAIDILKEVTIEDWQYGDYEALDMAIEALQQQRKAILPKHCIVPSGDYVATAGVPKRGKWLNYLKEGLKWKCSECGSKYTTPWHYCPNCGARMEVEK